jgi:hypothetical protein
MRQGMVPGLRVLPAYQNLTDYVMEVELTQNGRRNRGLRTRRRIRQDAQAVRPGDRQVSGYRL